MKRVFSRDASLGERATALAVSAAMKAKRGITKIGKSLKPVCCSVKKNKNKNKKKMRGKKNGKKKAITLKKIIKDAGTAMKKGKPISIDSAIKAALVSVNKSKSGKLINPQQRIIKMPSISGGVLPLIPIFAGLSALGSIVGSTTSILKAISEYKDAHKQLEESKRHNQTMESIAIGKGFYLRPYKSGRGFYLKPYPKN